MDKKEKITINKDGIDIEVLIDTELKTLYVSQKELAKLYGKSVGGISTTISKMRKNMDKFSINFRLISVSNVKKPITYYDLEIIKELDSIWDQNNYELLKEFLNKYLIENDDNIGCLDNVDNKVITYDNNGVKIDVMISPKSEDVWLTVKQISELYETTTNNIYIHIKAIYKEGELTRATGKDFLLVRSESTKRTVRRMVTYYNFDMILALGYRIKGKRAMEFRRWASSIIKQYSSKGYVIDKDMIMINSEQYLDLKNDIEDVKNKYNEIENKIFTEPLKEHAFFENQYFDARELITSLINKADKSVIMVDRFFDIRALRMFTTAKLGVKFYVILSTKPVISQMDIDIYVKQYGNNIRFIPNDSFHDRFLIIDKKDCYHIGTSFNYMGNRIFSIDRMVNDKIKEYIISLVEKEYNTSRDL